MLYADFTQKPLRKCKGVRELVHSQKFWTQKFVATKQLTVDGENLIFFSQLLQQLSGFFEVLQFSRIKNIMTAILSNISNYKAKTSHKLTSKKDATLENNYTSPLTL